MGIYDDMMSAGRSTQGVYQWTPNNINDMRRNGGALKPVRTSTINFVHSNRNFFQRPR